MTLLRRRLWGALLLSVLTAISVVPVEAATTSKSGSTTSVQSGSKTTRTGTKPRRRARRAPPPGGVYARNAVVLDPTTGEVLYEKNAAIARPDREPHQADDGDGVPRAEAGPRPRASRSPAPSCKGGGHTQLRNGEQRARSTTCCT